MSRFKIILAFIIFIVFIVGLFVWQYIASLHTVDFTITSGLSAKLYKVVDSVNQEPAISTIDTSLSLQLQNGDFCAVPSGTKYNNTPVCFTVDNKNINVVIEPNYSTDYLAQQLPAQLDTINAIINQKYSAIISNYTLITGSLYGHGEWYGTTLTQKVDPSDRGDIYRVLLEKKNNIWTIIAYPQIVLNKYNYPQVPFDILTSVNKLLGVY